MTRDEYEKAIDTYLMELQCNVSVLQDSQLKDSLDLITEIGELRQWMTDARTTNADIVGFCFGIVDEYIHHLCWNATISDGYNFYQDSQKTKYSRTEN